MATGVRADVPQHEIKRSGKLAETSIHIRLFDGRPVRGLGAGCVDSFRAFDGSLDSAAHLSVPDENPKRYLTIPGDYLSENFWFGATVTNQQDADRRIAVLSAVPKVRKFISFEPLLGVISNLDLDGIDQVILGAQTNPTVEVTPKMVQPIGAATCPGVVPSIKMFCKDSMPAWAKCRRELAWQVNK